MKGTPRTSRRMATNQQFLAPPFLFCLSLLFASLTPKHIINGSPHVALSIQWWAPKKRNHLNKIVYNRLGSTVKWGLIKFRQFENRPQLIFFSHFRIRPSILYCWLDIIGSSCLRSRWMRQCSSLYWVDGIFLFCCHPREGLDNTQSVRKRQGTNAHERGYTKNPTRHYNYWLDLRWIHLPWDSLFLVLSTRGYTHTYLLYTRLGISSFTSMRMSTLWESILVM